MLQRGARLLLDDHLGVGNIHGWRNGIGGDGRGNPGDDMISWIDFRDFFEINTGLYGTSQAPLPPAEMMVALLTVARATRDVDVEHAADAAAAARKRPLQ